LPKIINDLADLGSLREAWERRVEGGFSSPFNDLDFSSLWFRHHHAKASPLIVELETDSGVGVAPLRVENLSKGPVNLVRIGFLVSASWIGYDFIPPGLSQSAMDELVELFEDVKAGMIDLFALDVASPSLPRLIRSLEQKRHRYLLCRSPTWTSGRIELRGSWEDYLSSRSRKTRHNIKRSVRKVVGSGVQLRIFRSISSAEIQQVLDDVESVVSHSWKEPSQYQRGGFWRDFLELAVKKGWLTLYSLYSSTKMIAFLATLKVLGRAYFVQSAYHEEYSKISPGMYLISSAIRDAYAFREVKSIDFLTGYQYLRKLSTNFSSRIRLVAFPGGYRSTLLSKILRIREGLKQNVTLHWYDSYESFLADSKAQPGLRSLQAW